MINSTLNFDTMEDDNFITADYTSKDYISIRYMTELDDLDFVDYYRLDNDQTIEQLSFELYETTSYWDLLLLINGIDPLFDMCYNFDMIDATAKTAAERYNTNIYGGDLSISHIEYIENVIKDDLLEINETRRLIKIIRPSKLLDFMKLIRGI